MLTPSLGFKVINVRGFANTTNVRFAQLVDGMDIQSPHIGAHIGNALGPADLDIENVEIIPGVVLQQGYIQLKYLLSGMVPDITS